jgi:carbon storage regulator CsrA
VTDTRINARRENMLVLSRKKDETIILRQPGCEDITITVVRIDNRNKERNGIQADKKVTVLRSELTNESMDSRAPIGQISAETI